MVGAPGRRRQVAYAKSRGVPLRRACALFRTARSGLRLQSKRAKADAPVVSRLRELAGQYPRYGYRLMQLLLAQDGTVLSVERAIDSGEALAFRCRVSGLVSAPRPNARDPRRPTALIMCGRLISCSIRSQTADPSSA
jgi:hypothetical protein